MEVNVRYVTSEPQDFMIAVARDDTERNRIDAKLRTSEERLKYALDATRDGLWDWNIETGDVYFSPQWAHLLGYQHEEVPQRREFFFTILHPNDVECVTQALQDHLAGRTPVKELEIRLLTKSGEYLWVNDRGKVVARNESGSPSRMVGTITDITERKQAEQKLRASEARLNEAQRLSAIGNWELDLTTSTLVWSNEIFRIFEIDPQEFDASYEAFLNMVHPHDREIVNDAYTTSVANRQSYDIVHRLLMADGRIKFVRERCKTDYGATGQPLRSIGTVQDVTDRVVADKQRQEIEAALRESEERFSKAFRHNRVAMGIRHVNDDVLIEANDSFSRLMQRSATELVGQKVGDLGFYVNPSQRDEVLAKVHTRETIDGIELELKTGGGSTIHVLMSVDYFTLGGEMSVLASFIDISERKLVESQVQELRDALAHSNRITLLGEFASGLAHELNQPLGAIHLDANTALLISEKYDAPELQKRLQHIGEQSFRAGEIIRRMRAFIHRGANKRTPEDINQLVQEVLRLMGDHLRQHSVQLELNLAKDCLPIMVDGIQIQQVLVNIIRNADEAMRQNDDMARLISIRTTANATQIQVHIKDTGCGLDPAVAAKLFFPFQTTKAAGLGMGLSICQTIIESHGGRIEACPNQGRGTTFIFTLPVAP